jgi:iron(III) transport system substrate-binding protein
MKRNPQFFLLVLGLTFFATGMSHGGPALAQMTVSLSREQVIEQAKKEGKLLLHPFLRPNYGDKETIPQLFKAFATKYPFIQPTWGTVTQTEPSPRQSLEELVSGKAVVDVIGFSGSFPKEYVQQNVVMRHDLKAMARDGQLKIPSEMIDETGAIVWPSSNTGIIAYNTDLIPPDKAPKGWESCLDPQWKGKFSVDPKPNMLAWLLPRWGEERLYDYARKIKDNSPVWSRGSTRNLTLLAEGKLAMNCGSYIHPMSRLLKRNPGAPIKMVVPDPLPMTAHDPQAIYAGVKNPHAALLWLEFLASKEAQAIVDGNEPGRGSFAVEGNLVHKLAKGNNVSICDFNCLAREDKIVERIAVGIWGLAPPRAQE